jgi:hypothetical protein
MATAQRAVGLLRRWRRLRSAAGMTIGAFS